MVGDSKAQLAKNLGWVYDHEGVWHSPRLRGIQSHGDLPPLGELLARAADELRELREYRDKHERQEVAEANDR